MLFVGIAVELAKAALRAHLLSAMQSQATGFVQCATTSNLRAMRYAGTADLARAARMDSAKGKAAMIKVVGAKVVGAKAIGARAIGTVGAASGP